jgi:hypothetical protein
MTAGGVQPILSYSMQWIDYSSDEKLKVVFRIVMAVKYSSVTVPRINLIFSNKVHMIIVVYTDVVGVKSMFLIKCLIV